MGREAVAGAARAKRVRYVGKAGEEWGKAGQRGDALRPAGDAAGKTKAGKVCGAEGQCGLPFPGVSATEREWANPKASSPPARFPPPECLP
jgi:hypothetical protein